VWGFWVVWLIWWGGGFRGFWWWLYFSSWTTPESGRKKLPESTLEGRRHLPQVEWGRQAGEDGAPICKNRQVGAHRLRFEGRDKKKQVGEGL